MAFSANLEMVDSEARITLDGELDAAVAEQFRQAIEQAAQQKPQKLVLFMNTLSFMASAGLRVLVFAKQRMGSEVAVYVIGATGPVLNTLQMSGFHQAVYIQENYP
ncbi:MAG: STAS domain-containing protein [Candidatus Competibacteraceae bacterium]|nr:STAS domain-containing protein [Candidatus Competibacteraceae bacterium]